MTKNQQRLPARASAPVSRYLSIGRVERHDRYPRVEKRRGWNGERPRRDAASSTIHGDRVRSMSLRAPFSIESPSPSDVRTFSLRTFLERVRTMPSENCRVASGRRRRSDCLPEKIVRAPIARMCVRVRDAAKVVRVVVTERARAENIVSRST